MSSAPFSLRTKVELGVVPTHIKFVGGLVPDDQGRLPRGDDGALLVVSEMAGLKALCPAPIQSAQITAFPGVDAGDMDELITGLRALGLEVHIIMMVGGADPMNPADEDAVDLPGGDEVALDIDDVGISDEPPPSEGKAP